MDRKRFQIVGPKNYGLASNAASQFPFTGYLNKTVFLTGQSPASLLFIFGLFKQITQFLKQNNVKNVRPVSGAGI